MVDRVICPHCGKQVEISEALRHELQEQVLEEERLKHQKDREGLLKQMTEMTRQVGDLKRKDEERELVMEKKLLEREEKIKTDIKKQADEEQQLKFLEMQKKLDDAIKMNDELKRKLQQGSQQTQGEVLELELQETLEKEFPNDKISEVGKGVRGADVVQEVFEKTGKKTGVILWESKNAKWSEGWIEKLREDTRSQNANDAVLVSVELPLEVKNFGYYKGVWVTGRTSVVGLAWALRKNYWDVFIQKQMNEGKKEKAEEVYDYVNSIDFRHKVEGIVEAFNNLADDLEKEKRWFGLKWARQEKEIRRIMDNTGGMYGQLQGVSGRSLPEIKELEAAE